MSTMRIGGLASGMDIDSIVEKLMAVERLPLDKLEQKKQVYEWQRDAYREVNTKLQTLDKYIADNLILKGINSKTATSSNSDYVTATATGSAAGTLSIEGVFQLATVARGIGNQINAIGSTTLGELFQSYLADNPDAEPVTDLYIEIQAIQKDGKLASTPTKIEFTHDMTINEFINKINKSNAGVNVIFENGRFSITAKNTGDVKDGQEIVITSGKNVFKALGFSDPDNIVTVEGKNAIFKVNGIITERSSNSFSVSGYNVTLNKTFSTQDSQNMIDDYLQAAQIELTNAETDKALKYQALQNAINAYSGTVISNYVTQYNLIFADSFLDYDNLNTFKTFNNVSFFKNLTTDEMIEIQNITLDENLTDEEIKNIISNSSLSTSLKNKLKTLNREQLLLLDSLELSQLESYKKYAQFLDINDNNFFIQLKADEIAELKSLTINEEDTLENILDSISDESLRNKLKKFSLNQLVSIVENIDDYIGQAKVEELKKNYNNLGITFLKELSEDEITAISTINFDDENPFEGLEESLKEKLEGLSATQRTVLENIIKNTPSEDLESLLENLSNLATIQFVHDTAKSNLEKAEKAYQASVERHAIAQATFDKANELKNTGATEPPMISAPISVTSTTNVEEIITKIKDFVNTLNGLITDLNNLIKEEKYRDYKPLTAAQRKEMSEHEIELWEKKAKSGVLRNDDIIREGLSAIRALIYETNYGVVNEKFNTLFSIGITTSKNYLSGGTLEIDEDKLRAALEEDPDAVATLLSNSNGKLKDKVIVNGEEREVDTRGYLQKLRATFDSIKEKIELRAGRSSMTQTQYTIGRYLRDVDGQIEKWKAKLVEIETRYWNQFSLMEKMISKANHQSAMLMGQFYSSY